MDTLWRNSAEHYLEMIIINLMLSQVAASFTYSGILNQIKADSDIHMCTVWIFSIPYVLGGEELHPFGHLVAEAQKVVVGQSRRVADDQVHSAPT